VSPQAVTYNAPPFQLQIQELGKSIAHYAILHRVLLSPPWWVMSSEVNLAIAGDGAERFKMRGNEIDHGED